MSITNVVENTVETCMDSTKVFLIAHLGLGDNLYMNGAARFLSRFYSKVFFVCKHKYKTQIVQVFADNPKIQVVSLGTDEHKENANIIRLVKQNWSNPTYDFLVAGQHKQIVQRRILNQEFLKARDTFCQKKYTIDWDQLTTENYSFIESHYKDCGLDLTCFYEDYFIPELPQSIKLYETIKKFYIVFIQPKSSTGECLNLKSLLKQYKSDPGTIILCNDYNVYENANMPQKKRLAEPFVRGDLVNYVTTLKHCGEVHLIDSAFVGMILPLLKTNRLRTRNVKITLRCNTNLVARPMVGVSVGELWDKFSILKIKEARIKCPEKLKHVRREQKELNEWMSKYEYKKSPFWSELCLVNESLWDIEDSLRLLENDNDFGKRFVELARSVYKTNDRRAAIKRLINAKFKSLHFEVKSYA